MKNDDVLIAEAYQQIQEGMTDKVNKILDGIQSKFPNIYTKMTQAASPQKLKEFLLSPTLATTLGTAGFLGALDISDFGNPASNARNGAGIIAALVSSGIVTLYGILKHRPGNNSDRE